MTGLVIALVVEVVILLGGTWFKFEVDPDMHNEERRRIYVITTGIKFLIVVVITIAIWWYWHPISAFFEQDWKTIIEQHRPQK